MFLCLCDQKLSDLVVEIRFERERAKGVALKSGKRPKSDCQIGKEKGHCQSKLEHGLSFACGGKREKSSRRLD